MVNRQQDAGPPPLAERWRQAVTALFREREPALPPFLALYDAPLHFQDPLQVVRGLEAFEAMNRRFLSRARHLDLEVEPPLGSLDTFFATWRMRFAARHGPLITLDGVTQIQVGQERIIYHRDYFDPVGSTFRAVPGLGALYQGLLTRLA